ncbi:MAG: hypothetical protein IJB42_05870, partial [Oscillospiraceae bacterium]|nr:hypothetical protein [Oscillospiraceae bacterium]
YCPIFDQGAGLLSNVQFSPMDIIPSALIRVMRARPFNTTFNRQLHTVQQLYGKQMHLPRFNVDEIERMIDPMLEYYPVRDRSLILERVCEVVITRQKEV